jgi:nitrogen fixation protein NifU and related proteins
MSELRDLYQEVILDHGRRPRNHRCIEDADLSAEGHNPLCGDRLTLYLKMDGDSVADVSFEGSGCAISTASASMLTGIIRGKSESEARALLAAFVKMATADPDSEADDSMLGKLAVFAGVREFPMRVKCATLSWHTLESALDRSKKAAVTELEQA